MKAILFFSLFCIACSGIAEDNDPLDEEFGVATGKSDSNLFQLGSPQALAVVEFVNQPILSDRDADDFEKLLDTKLNRIAAKNIRTFRVGKDGKAQSNDDAQFSDIEELDGVKYVGKFAIQGLFELAKDVGFFVEKDVAKRVILFVGDGMGVGAISGTQYLADEKLEMLSMPELGWMSTHSHEFVTTDSAASASALASGRKTHFNGVSVVPGTEESEEEDPSHHLESFFDIAKSQGLGRGIVSTSRVVHATPAAFYAHRKTRKSYEEIAEDLVPAELDVVLGAGWQYFRDRSDNEDLSEKIKDQGIDYFEDPKQIDNFADRSTKLMGLFYKKDMPLLADANRSVSLSKMVDSAIKVLDRGHPEGWVLMVEGSFIDWCEHALRPECTFLETQDFDNAIGVARAYADTRRVKDTLIVVTADHETGGLSIINSEDAETLAQAVRTQNVNNSKVEQTIEKGEGFRFGNFIPQASGLNFAASFGSMSQASALLTNSPFFRAAHTPNFVPIFAQGPSAKFIAGSKDNALLGLNLKRVVSQEAFPAQLQEEAPKNMVLFLGARLGVSAVTFGKYSEGESSFLDMHEHGLIAPTKIGGGIVPSTNALFGGEDEFNKNNLLSLAAQSGKDVALISDRLDSPLLQIIEKNENKADFIYSFDADNSNRIQEFEGLGYEVQTTWPPTNDKNIFGDFGSLLGGNAKTKLFEALQVAIDRLQKNAKGFLLIVDLSSANDEIEMMIKLRDFDGAVKQALSTDLSDTLVLVTGDRDQTMSVIDNHYGFESNQCGAAERCGGDLEYEDHDVVKHGGFLDTQLQGADFSPVVMMQYSWLVRASGMDKNNKNLSQTTSENFLPIFSQGAGSSHFRGFHNQKEVGKKLIRFWK